MENPYANSYSEIDVQSLQHHHQPSRDHRTVPGHQQIRGQPAADARRIPGLPGAGPGACKEETGVIQAIANSHSIGNARRRPPALFPIAE